MISVFELFSIGIGPSSSHTVGPMRAARDFLSNLQTIDDFARIRITVYGSLAFTGHGHGTDRALMMGLAGETPEGIDPGSVNDKVDAIYKTHLINLLGRRPVPFYPSHDLIYNYEDSYSYHPNAMKFSLLDENEQLLHEMVYFSIGGGFIIREPDLAKSEEHHAQIAESYPYPFNSAAELLRLCQQNNLTISELMMANETVRQDSFSVRKKLLHIADIMELCIKNGCNTEGVLPGGLNVKRRAALLYKKLIQQGEPAAGHPQKMNWLNVYAMAVNEENAAGGRVVTAPTNGAAGIIPATLQYYKYFCKNANEDGIVDFMLTAGAIGMLYKMNASISGAEMGCQGEVGVACSMAAAGLAAALGCTLFQIENAAEMAMEHNLGLTCDPVNGLVQIPCIERNAMATVKAVNAAELALLETGEHKISLDMVISTMREIGMNMNSIYKETSQGGLAVAVNLSEC